MGQRVSVAMSRTLTMVDYSGNGDNLSPDVATRYGSYDGRRLAGWWWEEQVMHVYELVGTIILSH
jgi:hypothetical protein